MWQRIKEHYAKKRTETALWKRGICRRHLKPLTEHRTDPENPRGFNALCEDCVVEWGIVQELRVKTLIEDQRKRLTRSKLTR